jgi:hypothetical protein
MIAVKRQTATLCATKTLRSPETSMPFAKAAMRVVGDSLREGISVSASGLNR